MNLKMMPLKDSPLWWTGAGPTHAQAPYSPANPGHGAPDPIPIPTGIPDLGSGVHPHPRSPICRGSGVICQGSGVRPHPHPRFARIGDQAQYH